MKIGRTIGALIAMATSASSHLALLNAFSESQPPALIKGGSVQVEIGLGSASSQASAAGASKPADTSERTETPDTQEKPKNQTTPPNPATVTEPKRKPQEKAPSPAKNIAPVIPIEKPIEPAPYKAAKQTQTDDQSKNAKNTAQPKRLESGAPSIASVGNSSGDSGPDRPASKAGNSESENYAGLVMEHLSRIRRPRAVVAGSARVAFTIAPSGELENVRIVSSSGSAKFDREAVKMVERAAPYPKPPPSVNRALVVEIEGR